MEYQNANRRMNNNQSPNLRNINAYEETPMRPTEPRRPSTQPETGIVPPIGELPETGIVPPIGELPETGIVPPIGELPNPGITPPIGEIPNPGIVPPIGTLPPAPMPPIYVPDNSGAGHHKCLNKLTFIWTINDETFWMYPTSRRNNRLYGYRYSQQAGWYNYSLPLRNIIAILCPDM